MANDHAEEHADLNVLSLRAGRQFEVPNGSGLVALRDLTPPLSVVANPHRQSLGAVVELLFTSIVDLTLDPFLRFV